MHLWDTRKHPKGHASSLFRNDSTFGDIFNPSGLISGETSNLYLRCESNFWPPLTHVTYPQTQRHTHSQAEFPHILNHAGLCLGSHHPSWISFFFFNCMYSKRADKAVELVEASLLQLWLIRMECGWVGCAVAPCSEIWYPRQMETRSCGG